jgi:hypothetical protein
MIVNVYSTGHRSQFHQHFMTNFAPKSFRQKITNPNCKHLKLRKKLSYEKAARKILVKLTPGGSITPRYVLQLLFCENRKIANNSTTKDKKLTQN